MDLAGVRSVRVPRSRDELRLGPGALPVGGGSWVYSEPQPGVEELVDLTGLGWEPVERDAEGGLVIAATCSVATLAGIAPDPRWGAGVSGLFRQAAEALLASWKVWGAATVGGNLCLGLPAGAMIALAAGLDGEALIWQPDGAGERRVPVAEFVRAPRDTALRPGEVLRSIALPARALEGRAALRKAALAPLGRSGALLVARRDASGAFALTITASVPAPRRAWFPALPTAAELAGRIDEEVRRGGGWFDDPHGSPEWRRAVTLLLAEELREELA